MSVVLSCAALEQKYSSLIDKCNNFFFLPQAKILLVFSCTEISISQFPKGESSSHNKNLHTKCLNLGFSMRLLTFFKMVFLENSLSPNFCLQFLIIVTEVRKNY